MKITSKFTIAIQTLGKEYKMTSQFLASSVNVNSVIIRRTLLSLKVRK